jgi:hypothetical protein
MINIITMITTDDILRYTARVGGDMNYNVVETSDNYVRVSWDSDGETKHSKLFHIKDILQSGHIKIYATHSGKPSKHLRHHTFNPRSRNLPWRKGRNENPYLSPRYFLWR